MEMQNNFEQLEPEQMLEIAEALAQAHHEFNERFYPDLFDDRRVAKAAAVLSVLSGGGFRMRDLTLFRHEDFTPIHADDSYKQMLDTHEQVSSENVTLEMRRELDIVAEISVKRGLSMVEVFRDEEAHKEALREFYVEPRNLLDELEWINDRSQEYIGQYAVQMIKSKIAGDYLASYPFADDYTIREYVNSVFEALPSEYIEETCSAPSVINEEELERIHTVAKYIFGTEYVEADMEYQARMVELYSDHID